MQQPVKKMTVKEFRQLGYLQELNRRFLHPLGLALEVNVSESHETFSEGIWDYRDDPEGLIFGPGIIDPEKAKRIYHEQAEKASVRTEKLGYAIQPEEA